MRLVKRPVDHRVVQTTVDPVDEEIGKEDEERNLEDAVVGERLVGNAVVQFGVTPNFKDKERRRQEGHGRHRRHGLLHFEFDLALEELGVIVSGLVPDEDIGSGGDNEVHEEAKDPKHTKKNTFILLLALTLISMGAMGGLSLPPVLPGRGEDRQGGIVHGIKRYVPCDQEETGELTVDVIARPRTEVGIFGRLQVDQLCGGLVHKGLCRAKEGQSTVGDIHKGRQTRGG